MVVFPAESVPTEVLPRVEMPAFRFPVVEIFCDPKSGTIFVPSIAALPLTSALTIVRSAMSALVT